MFRLLSGIVGAAVGATLILSADAPAYAASTEPAAKPRYGFGRPATPQEIAG
jgi:hypothetical protein